MKALSLIVALLVSWAAIASAQSVTKTVTGNAGPWNFVSGGLNTSYQYSYYPHTAPIVVSGSDGVNFSAGLSLAISYVSGFVSIGSDWPSVDAGGDTAHPLDNGNWGSIGPSYYMNPSTYPIYAPELVGTFATSTGQIVGTPFAIGNLGTFVIPVGATQLQLGVNDVGYGDNTGSWNIKVANVPEPTTVTLVLLGLAGFGLTARRRQRS